MAAVTNLVSPLIHAYCREHIKRLERIKPPWYSILKKKPEDVRFTCPVCGICVTEQDIVDHCYAPKYWQQRNPFVEYKHT